jgi:hypothetical protein
MFSRLQQDYAYKFSNMVETMQQLQQQLLAILLIIRRLLYAGFRRHLKTSALTAFPKL